MNRKRLFQWALIAVSGAVFTGCTEDLGTVNVQVVTPVGGGAHCQYRLAPVQLRTMQNLTKFEGALGRVVYSNKDVNSEPEMQRTGKGFSAVDGQFGKSGDTYFPLDYHSLYAASLYNAVETGYRITSGLLPSADFLAYEPDFAARTLIVHQSVLVNTQGAKKGEERVDNATFRAVFLPLPGGGETVRNFLLSHPTDTTPGLPLGLNLGIMVHEYMHLVTNSLFTMKLRAGLGEGALTQYGQRVLQSIDEGISDYLGFLATEDPGYFNCSNPRAARDLSNSQNTFYPQFFTYLRESPSFDPHEGGAIFAAANYAMALRQNNDFSGQAESILNMVDNLYSCLSRNGSLRNVSFNAVANCHALAAGGSRSNTIRSIYREWGIQSEGNL